MSFKKIKYNQGEEIFKVKIEHPDGSILENWVFMKYDFPKWVKMIMKKYNLGFKEEKEKDRDLDWTK